jgi:hypothetical protein
MDSRFVDVEKMDGRYVNLVMKVDARSEEMNRRFMGLQPLRGKIITLLSENNCLRNGLRSK